MCLAQQNIFFVHVPRLGVLLHDSGYFAHQAVDRDLLLVVTEVLLGLLASLADENTEIGTNS